MILDTSGGTMVISKLTNSHSLKTCPTTYTYFFQFAHSCWWVEPCLPDSFKLFFTASSPVCSIFVFLRSGFWYSQIVRLDRSMEQIVFPVPNICKFLTEETKHRVFTTTEQDEQGSKVSDFFDQSSFLHNEMEWQKKLRSKHFLKNLLIKIWEQTVK